MCRRFNVFLLPLFSALFLLPLAGASGAGPAPQIGEHLVGEPIFSGRAFIREAGREKAVAVMLVHGLGDLASGTWDELIPDLARDYHVLAVDLPGFGRSSKGNALYSPERYAAYLNWVVQSYAAEKPVMVVGHSLGGAVGLYYAAAYPNGLERLVVVDAAGILHRNVITRELVEPNLRERLQHLPPPIPNERLGQWIEGLFSRLPDLPVDFDQILSSEILRGRFLAGDPARIAALALVQEDFGPLLRRIRVPTAILWGAEDQVTPLRTGVLLESVLPRAGLQVIPGAGHVPMFDQPVLFAQALSAALTGPVSPPLPPLPAATPVAVCKGESGLTFSGAYERIDVTDCSDIRLTHISARSVTISRSRVILENGAIRGPGTPLRVSDSTLTATGLRVEGDVALFADGSRLDLAGATLIGRQAAVVAGRPSRLLFSASRADSPLFRGYLHGVWEITPERPL